MGDYAAAYRALEDAALAHQRGDLMTGRDLVKASLAHAAAHALESGARAQQQKPAEEPKPGPSSAPTNFPPFGRSGGSLIKGAALDTLRFYETWARKAVDDPARSRWVKQNQALLDAVRAELRRQGQAADHG